MSQMKCLLPAVSMLLAGCVSAPQTDLTADHPGEKAQIQRRLSEVFDAAERKDFVRLDGYHLYGPKFTKFGGESPVRQDAAAARTGEHDGLGAINDLSMRAEDLKIDVIGDVGIATFVLDYRFKVGADTVRKQARATMVFAREHGEWKIVHEHLSAPAAKP